MAKKRTIIQTRAAHFTLVRESVRQASDRVTQARTETSKIVQDKSDSASPSRATGRS